MLRQIFALIIGLLILWLLGYILPSFSQIFGARLWLILIIYLHLPFLIAALITGYVAQRKGWLFGILIPVFFLIYLFIDHISEIQREGLRLHAWWLIITTLLTGMFGGYLGQLLAQKWLKKKYC